MKAEQKIEKVTETRTQLNLSKHIGWGLLRTTKRHYRFLILVAVAVAGSAVLGGNIWLWIVGLLVGRVVIRLLLTVALAICIYALFYALVIGGILWVLIP